MSIVLASLVWLSAVVFSALAATDSEAWVGAAALALSSVTVAFILRDDREARQAMTRLDSPV